MTIKELELLGYYKPGFLHLHINTEQDLELNSILQSDQRLFSTFIHEYIHFLQNFTTTIGLYESTDYIQYLKDMISNIEEESHSFNIPLKTNNKFNRISKNKIAKIYRGDISTCVNNIAYIDYLVEYNSISDINGSQINAPKYIINYYNEDKCIDGKYELGTIAIKEYIAHAIQNQFYKIKHPDIPYMIVDHIIAKEIPELEDNIKLKVMLCEASLMSLHPARTFISAIERMKNSGVLPKSGLEMYNYVHKDMRYVGVLGDFDYLELFKSFYDSSIYDYGDALGSPVFETELNWIKYIFENGYSLRVSRPDFILELINEPSIAIQKFKEILEMFGTPFMTNNAGKGSFLLPINYNEEPRQIYILSAVAEVMSVISVQKGCNMIGFCKSDTSRSKAANSKCLSRPWKKMNEETLCPFCQLWKNWEIYKKEPIVQRKSKK